MQELSDPLSLFVIAVTVALIGAATNRPTLLALGKPLATLMLIGVAWSGPVDTTVILIVLGLLLSTAGDVALLLPGARPFLVGLTFFLVAQLVYTVAFLHLGFGAFWTPFVGLVIFGVASWWLVRRLWPRVTIGMQKPVAVYSGTSTVMAAAAFATLAGPMNPAAAVAAALGALFFYFSDANLAWNEFVESYPQAQTVTLSLYWAGQLGIALSARWALSLS